MVGLHICSKRRIFSESAGWALRTCLPRLVESLVATAGTIALTVQTDYGPPSRSTTELASWAMGERTVWQNLGGFLERACTLPGLGQSTSNLSVRVYGLTLMNSRHPLLQPLL